MGGSILSSGKHAIQQFINQNLFPLVAGRTCPRAFNLEDRFEAFLTEEGAPSALAAERSEDWQQNLRNRVEERLQDWEALGLPRPMDVTEDGKTFVTWKHPKYKTLTGRNPVPLTFPGIYEWIGEQGEADFLFVCACTLRIIGANPILVTDTSGDGGIDLLGRLAVGPMRSVIIAVQAKSSKALISRDVVLAEYGKYMALRATKKYEEYRRAIGGDSTRDGVGW